MKTTEDTLTYAYAAVLVLLLNTLAVVVWAVTPDMPTTLVLLPALGGIFAVLVGLREAWVRREDVAETAPRPPLARVFANGDVFDAWVSPDLTVVFGRPAPRETWTSS